MIEHLNMYVQCNVFINIGDLSEAASMMSQFVPMHLFTKLFTDKMSVITVVYVFYKHSVRYCLQ